MKSQPPQWVDWIEKSLPLYGHRNWIVVADAAYPAQARAGIETIATGEGQEAVVETLLARLSSSKHVRPIVHTDREMAFGMSGTRRGLGLIGIGWETRWRGCRSIPLRMKRLLRGWMRRRRCFA